jgi:hypothetical protein
MYNNQLHVCCQSFHSKLNSPPQPHTTFPKTYSRRLLLPTGMTLVIESDSEEEEEHEQKTQANAPRALPAVTGTANVSCCTHQRKIPKKKT